MNYLYEILFEYSCINRNLDINSLFATNVICKKELPFTNIKNQIKD